jgi:hypothetical protein
LRMSRNGKPWLAPALKAEHGFEPKRSKLACLAGAPPRGNGGFD